MYTSEEKFCILCGENGISPGKFYETWNLFDGYDDLAANIGKSDEAKSLLADHYKSVCDGLKNGAVDKIINDMQKNGVVAVSSFSSAYPDKLKELYDAPYVLFCRGDVSLLNTECISVVGTRKMSAYGRRIATDFTRKICEKFTVVSGMALGVDGVAHETTLEEGGKTIAVLGSGVLNIYPPANRALYEKILDGGGLIISEYGLYDEALQYHFPQRNRIVAGLSRGLLVCQAPLKSGTYSTVNFALEQGKDVFVIPGEVYDFGFAGSNSLIKSMQGAMVTTPMDILDYYGQSATESEQTTVQLDFDEQQVVDALSTGPLSFDALVIKTKLPFGQLNYLLSELELKNIVAKLPGNVYRLFGELK